MHSPFKLVRPCCIAEQSRDTRLNLASSLCISTACLLHYPTRKFVLAHRKILSDVIENLRPVMGCASSPATRCMCGFNGITNVFAIAFAHLANDAPGGIVDVPTIARIWSHLFALDEHLWRAIDRWVCRLVTIRCSGGIHLVIVSHMSVGRGHRAISGRQSGGRRI